jgi:hypothetical protein
MIRHRPERVTRGVERCRLCGAERTWLAPHSKGKGPRWVKDGKPRPYCRETVYGV